MNRELTHFGPIWSFDDDDEVRNAQNEKPITSAGSTGVNQDCATTDEVQCVRSLGTLLTDGTGCCCGGVIYFRV